MPSPWIDHFIALFVVIDPVGLAAVFMGLVHAESPDQRRRLAIRGVLIAAIVLLVFVFAGDATLHMLGITLPAFQVAGGILLLLLAIDMLFARHSGLRPPGPPENREASHSRDIAVFPLAIPLIAGPGTFTTLLLMIQTAHERPMAVLGVVLMLLAVLAIALVALLGSIPLLRVIGETGASVFSRVLGVLLSALAIQFILDGVRQALLRH